MGLGDLKYCLEVRDGGVGTCLAADVEAEPGRDQEAGDGESESAEVE